MKDSLFTTICKDPTFKRLAVPVQGNLSSDRITDATFYLRYDGLLVNSEGWWHPPAYLLGEVLYAPDPAGNKIFFGQTYRKVTLIPGTYESVPYSQRSAILKQYDPSLVQADMPYFATYKQLFPLSEIVASFPPEHSFAVALEDENSSTSDFRQDEANLRMLLEVTPTEMPMGLTGAPALGQTQGYHDLDIVFLGTLDQNRAIAQRMKELAQTQPWRRCFEGRKGWSIRLLNDRRKLMCCFFSYGSPIDAPLSEFKMEVEDSEVEIEGTVCDDTHSMYTPTVLHLEKTSIRSVNGRVSSQVSEKEMIVIIYHTASRGDCYEGDRVRGRGALVTVQKASATFRAVCIIEREGLRNLTPPWEGYYTSNWGV